MITSHLENNYSTYNYYFLPSPDELPGGGGDNAPLAKCYQRLCVGKQCFSIPSYIILLDNPESLTFHILLPGIFCFFEIRSSCETVSACRQQSLSLTTLQLPSVGYLFFMALDCVVEISYGETWIANVKVSLSCFLLESTEGKGSVFTGKIHCLGKEREVWGEERWTVSLSTSPVSSLLSLLFLLLHRLLRFKTSYLLLYPLLWTHRPSSTFLMVQQSI